MNPYDPITDILAGDPPRTSPKSPRKVQVSLKTLLLTVMGLYPGTAHESRISLAANYLYNIYEISVSFDEAKEIIESED